MNKNLPEETPDEAGDYAGRLVALRGHISRYKKSPPRELRKAVGKPRVGDVWCPTEGFEDAPWLVLLETTNGETCLAAPVFHEVEYAGPNDVLLPRALLGFEVAVAIGATFDLQRSSLGKLEAELPDQWTTDLQKFRRWVSGELKERPGLETGIEYIYEKDLRLGFLKDLIDRTASLRTEQPEAVISYEPEPSTIPSRGAIVAWIRNAWERILGSQLEDLASGGIRWVPTTAPVALSQSGSAIPVITVSEDGARSQRAVAHPVVSLPAPEACWRLEPELPEFGGSQLALVRKDGPEPVGFAILGDSGASISLAGEIPNGDTSDLAFVLITGPFSP